MSTADVVVIGGGVVGAATAYQLACLDPKRRIVLLERESLLGAGSTSKCAGGVRLQFGTEINIRLSLEAIRMYENFAQDMEYETTFFQHGYLFLLSQAPDVEQFRKNVALQQSLGCPVEMITPEAARKILPQIRIDDLQAATFCPKDGFISTGDVMAGFERQARRHGVDVRLDAPVTRVAHPAPGRFSVTTPADTIETPTLVIAAGAWAKQIGAMLGLSIPIEPVRRHVFVTRPFDGIQDPFPLTVDFATRFYFHRESGGVLLGRSKLEEPVGYDTTVDWDYLPEVIEAALHRVPILEQAEIATGWAGLYEMTADAHPIVGDIPGVPGLYLAAGFSGHGFMHAPVIGRLMAELICTGRPHLDISRLSIRRFQEGRRHEEYAVI